MRSAPRARRQGSSLAQYVNRSDATAGGGSLIICGDRISFGEL